MFRKTIPIPQPGQHMANFGVPSATGVLLTPPPPPTTEETRPTERVPLRDLPISRPWLPFRVGLYWVAILVNNNFGDCFVAICDFWCLLVFFGFGCANPPTKYNQHNTTDWLTAQAPLTADPFVRDWDPTPTFIYIYIYIICWFFFMANYSRG